MSRIRDLILELRIWWALQEARACRQPGLARGLWRRHALLVAERSPEQVARMEQRMGLR